VQAGKKRPLPLSGSGPGWQAGRSGGGDRLIGVEGDHLFTQPVIDRRERGFERDNLVAEKDASERKRLLRDIGRELRKRNQRCIARQTAPDGTPWEPRKRTAAGKIRKRVKMLQGMREIRRLALTATPGDIEIGYSGRTGRLAEVHHLGEVDAVAKDGPRVKYPARELLGWAADDIAYVRERLMQAVGER
jgi:phage virion morphogenesis protein